MFYQNRLWVVMFIFGLCLGCVGRSSPEPVRPEVKAETDAYVVNLTGEEAGNNGEGKRFTFAVFNKRSQSRTTLQLSNQTDRVDYVRIVNARLLVFGELSVHAHIITILDLNRGESIDCIYGYNPSLSKTGRYLIYNKFYPRFAPLAEASAVYLIYDLSATPEKNRPGDTDSKDCEQVGYPVYPEDNYQQKTYQALVSKSQAVHTLVSDNFLWLAEDSKVLFVDRQGDENRLVALDLSRWLEKVQIKQVPIDVQEILSAEDKKNPSIVAKAKNTLYVTELKQRDDGRIRIKLAPQSYFRVNEMDVNLP